MSLRVARRLDGVERTLIRRIFDSAPPGAINLGLGQPDLPTPAVVSLAGIAGIVQGRTGYTSTAGDPQLREAIARTIPHIAPGPDNVLVTVGSQEALFVSCLALLDPGDEVLYPDPGYPAYPVVARLVGACPVAYRPSSERGFRLRADDILARLTSRTRLVIFSSPSNPTGACDPREELQILVKELARRNVAWISDEIYSSYRYGSEIVSPGTMAPDGGLVVSGLSKDMSMTGWRVGWVAGPAPIIARIIASHQYLVTCAPSVSQRAAVAAFTERAAEERASRLERFRHRRELMALELSRIPCVRFEKPEGGFYFFVDVSSLGGSEELARAILDRRGVVTIPGVAFGRGGEGYLRLSFAADEADIVNGVRKIGAELTAQSASRGA